MERMYEYDPWLHPQVTKADSKDHAEEKFNKGLFFATGLGIPGMKGYRPHFFHELMNTGEVSYLRLLAKRHQDDKDNIYVKISVIDHAKNQQDAFRKIADQDYKTSHPLDGIVVRANQLYAELLKYRRRYFMDFLQSEVTSKDFLLT